MEPEKAENVVVQSKPRIKKLKLFSILALAVLVVLFVAQNWEEDKPYLIFREVPMPRSVMLIVTAGIGFVVGRFTRTRLIILPSSPTGH